MPNWIKGTMKLRGKRENIRRFFNECLEGSCDNSREESVKDNSRDDYLEFVFKNTPYVSETRRMFVEDGVVEMFQEEGVCCVKIFQAWSFSSRESGDLGVLQKIADKFCIDIRLFGIECGMEFIQEVIVKHSDKDGKHPRIVDNCITFEDWDWECPFPYMGG